MMESTKEYISKLTDEQKAILVKYDVTEEDLWDMKQSLLDGTSDRDYQKEMVIQELINRKTWTRAYEKWMDRIDAKVEEKRQRDVDKYIILHALKGRFDI